MKSKTAHIPALVMAAAGPARIRLSWTRPVDGDMTHVTIRFSTVGTPAGPDDEHRGRRRGRLLACQTEGA